MNHDAMLDGFELFRRFAPFTNITQNKYHDNRIELSVHLYGTDTLEPYASTLASLHPESPLTHKYTLSDGTLNVWVAELPSGLTVKVFSPIPESVPCE